METVILFRKSTSSHGTFGQLYIGWEPLFVTGEPPWKDNKPNYSCIPTGKYLCVWHKSPKYGWCYLVTGVDGRGFILGHSGNYCGDKELGLKTHTLGCILIGLRKGFLGDQRAVLVSRTAVRRFNNIMEQKDFNLIII